MTLSQTLFSNMNHTRFWSPCSDKVPVLWYLSSLCTSQEMSELLQRTGAEENGDIKELEGTCEVTFWHSYKNKVNALSSFPFIQGSWMWCFFFFFWLNWDLWLCVSLINIKRFGSGGRVMCWCGRMSCHVTNLKWQNPWCPLFQAIKEIPQTKTI